MMGFERLPAQSANGWPNYLAWLPLPLWVGAAGALACVPGTAVFNPPYLLPALNILFLTSILLLVAVLAARSYLARHSVSVLLLGGGALALGLAGALAGGLPLPKPTPNWMVTVYNTSASVAAVCHLSSALLGFRLARRLPRSGWPALAALYLAVIATLLLLAWAAHGHWLPVFFVEGQGSTRWNRAVLWTTAGMFALAGMLLGVQNRQGRSAFVFWYGLGLGLIAVGLVSVSLQKRLGSPLNWCGRTAQYLGGVYMLIAVLRARRGGRRWTISLADALHEMEERYRKLVELCPDAILVHADGKCVFANPAAAMLFGAAAPAELFDRDVLELVHPEDREAVARRIRQARTDGLALPLVELRILRLDGRSVHVESAGSRIDCQGRPAVQVVMRDVTERKQAETALRHAHDQLDSRVRERTAELARTNEALQASHQQIRALAVRLAEWEETERRRLARELHDQVGQTLTALGLNLNIIRQRMSADTLERVGDRLDEAIGQLEALTDDVRQIMGELRPAVLDDYGLAATLRWYCEQVARRTGLAVELRAGELPARLPLETETALFRIAQEALTNVAKHARARRIEVVLEETAAGIRLTLADDGVGFDPGAARDPQGQTGWGQLIMRERAAAVGGRLSVESAPGRGTRIVVEVGE